MASLEYLVRDNWGFRWGRVCVAWYKEHRVEALRADKIIIFSIS